MEDGIADGFARSLVRLGASVARRPWRALPAAAELASNLVTAGARTAALAVGQPRPPVVTPEAKDRRFADPAWRTNPWFYATGQAYLAGSRFMNVVAEQGSQKAQFAVGALVDALAPTNFLHSNPAALRRAYETRGESLKAGLTNLVADVTTNKGRPRQVDPAAFTVGQDLAATPGQVVFRNDLMELIQYEASTETVHETPLLMSPPWINKYYIMDLAPGRSFVEWAVQHGHTVFAISYRNPDESMRDVALDDYLIRGLNTAVDVIREITGAEDVNVAGLCVGGTLAVMLHAYEAQAGRRSIRSLTLLNTLIDFSDPGDLAVFTDAATVDRIEKRMAERGFLDEVEMATTFDFLRANDLIWSYVASGWLMGEPAPTFDILAWNSDATRISEATHSFYLRAFYRENRLAQGELSLAGTHLDLDLLEADTYVLAAAEDHITPWKSSYKTTGLLPTKIQFVLSSSGHIAGVVNPPSNKRHYWTNDDLPEDPDQWLAGATQQTGSWWGDWAAWIGDRAGTQRLPPPVGSATHPPLVKAPGTYVRRDS